MKINTFLTLLLTSALLAGCSTRGTRAPIYERGKVDQTQNKSARETDWRPEAHVVQKGDTLYSIAFIMDSIITNWPN